MGADWCSAWSYQSLSEFPMARRGFLKMQKEGHGYDNEFKMLECPGLVGVVNWGVGM